MVNKCTVNALGNCLSRVLPQRHGDNKYESFQMALHRLITTVQRYVYKELWAEMMMNVWACGTTDHRVADRDPLAFPIAGPFGPAVALPIRTIHQHPPRSESTNILVSGQPTLRVGLSLDLKPYGPICKSGRRKGLTTVAYVVFATCHGLQMEA